MITMKVLGITLDGATNTPILVMQTEKGEEILPVWIGAAEAMAISMALNNVNPERPLSHTLLLSAMETLGARLIGLSITELREGTFYALLEMLADQRLVQVDCRPSDGIVLALRAGAPIRIAESVLAKAAADRVDVHSSPADRRPSDNAESLIRGTVASSTFDASQPASGKASTPASEEQRLAELLRTLEPASKRVM